MRPLRLLTAIAVFTLLTGKTYGINSCAYKLMDTTFQKAIMKKHRIPDAHEWFWYGVELRPKEKLRLVHWFATIIKGNEYEIHDIFTALGKEPHEPSDQIRYYRHPQYVEMVQWLLDTYVQHPDSFIQPEDTDVATAYLNAIEVREKRFEIGFDFDLDVKGICQAAADAAGYFFWLDLFGQVQKFMTVMDQYDCRNEDGTAQDFTGFETGHPQPLTQAIKLMDSYGFLPAGYAFEGGNE